MPKTKTLKAATQKLLQFSCSEKVNLHAADGSESNVRPFEMVAYSGGKLYVDGFPEPVIVDLSGVTVKAANGEGNNVPVTLDHDDKQRVGHANEVKIGFNQIIMAGATSAETAARDEVIKSAQAGFKWSASIEGHVREQQLVKAGQSRVINGRRQEGPFIHAKRFVLRKVSFVTSGGDEDNVVSLAAKRGDENMDPEFKEWLEAKPLDPAEVEANETLNTVLMAAWKNETKLPKASAKRKEEEVPDDDGDKIGIAAQMRKEAADAAKLIASVRKACQGDDELFAKAMEENWDPVKAELEFLRKERETGVPAIHVSEGETQDGQVIEAALLASCGKRRDSDFKEEVLEASDKIKGFGLHALMHSTIKAAGKYYQPGQVDNGFIRAALEADQILKASSGYSTLSMSGILSNIANKSLLSAYENVDGIMGTICQNVDTNDFKTFTMYRFIGGGKLLPIGPTGEIKHTEFDAESYTNKVETYARMASLTREMQINDDLGAFLQIPSSFGRQAALTLEKTGFATLLAAISGAAFFTSGRGNLVSGTVALGDAGLTEAKTLFMNQVDGSTHTPDGQTVGDPIMMRGQYLLVPPAHDDLAARLMNSRELLVENRDTTHNTAATLYPPVNTHYGAYQVLTSPWFGTKHAISGSSNTHWLILANPMDSPVIQCARLRGQRAPVLESAEADFNKLGMQWRTYMDFGFAMHDYRAGVYSPGA